MPHPLHRHLAILLAASALAAACGANQAEPVPTSAVVPITAATATTAAGSSSTAGTTVPEPTTTASTLATTTVPTIATFPGMPPVIDPENIYSEAVAGKMSPNTDGALEYVYVPSNDDGTITVIDQKTFEIVDKYRTY